MRVIATRGRARLGAAALAAAAPMLADLERYVGGRTPFAKLDFLAVPTFNGAMENPGLITFAAPILLVEPAGASPTPSWRERHRLMAGVMAHELAHLWFGDLVTMRWWDELWLNEGLATWMSERLMAAVYPADAGQVLDVADKVQGLAMDRVGVQAAVRRAIEKPPDIGDAFSPLSYRKGGAIVSMFEAYLGEARMRDGLRRYLAENAGGSVTTAKLASALSGAGGGDLGPALSSFLDQPGVPLVDAKLECDGRPRVSLRQSAYAALGAGQDPAAAARRWHIPVCVAWQGGAAPACTMLSSEQGSIALPTDRCPSWIHPNPGERGYYIYSLPAAQLRALAAAPLSPREQAGLADDVDALVAAGVVPLDAGLDVLWSLARGQDELAALRAAQTLDLLARAVVGPRQQQSFAAGLRAALGPRAHQLGLSAREGESSLQSELREAVVPLVGREGNDRALQAEALRRLSRWLDQPHVRSAAPSGEELTLLAQLAPLAGGEPLFERVLAAAGTREQARAALVLGGFRQPALVERALAAVRGGRVDAHALGLLSALLGDVDIADRALPAALARYPHLSARLPERERARSAVVFASICRSAARADVEEVLRRVLAQGGKLPPFAAAVLDRIASCAALGEHYGAAAGRLLR
jgi:alanyl aminopeptidase